MFLVVFILLPLKVNKVVYITGVESNAKHQFGVGLVWNLEVMRHVE